MGRRVLIGRKLEDSGKLEVLRLLFPDDRCSRKMYRLKFCKFQCFIFFVIYIENYVKYGKIIRDLKFSLNV